MMMRCLSPTTEPCAAALSLESFNRYTFCQKYQIEFTVVFPHHQLGLGFQQHVSKKPPPLYQVAVKEIVLRGPRRGYAAEYNESVVQDTTERLVPRLRIMRVNDTEMANVPYANVLRLLHTAKRPIAITFFDPTSAPYEPNQTAVTINRMEMQDILDSHTDLAHEHRRLSVEMQEEKEKHGETRAEIETMRLEKLAVAHEMDELRAEHQDMMQHANDLHDRLIQAQTAKRHALQDLDQLRQAQRHTHDQLTRWIEKHRESPQCAAMVDELLQALDLPPIEQFDSTHKVVAAADDDATLDRVRQMLRKGIAVRVQQTKKKRFGAGGGSLKRILFADDQLQWISWIKPQKAAAAGDVDGLTPNRGAMIAVSDLDRVVKEGENSMTLSSRDDRKLLVLDTDSAPVCDDLVNGIQSLLRRRQHQE